jgi:hypothetical protein
MSDYRVSDRRRRYDDVDLQVRETGIVLEASIHQADIDHGA